MLDLIVFLHTQVGENIHQLLRAEETQQIILQGQVEAGLSRVSLTSGTSPQLVVNTAGLMALCADDL